MTGFSVVELGVVATIFFVVEIITDKLLTYLMSTFFDIPLLSATPKMELMSKDSLNSGVMLAFLFTAMSACIAMAATMPL